MDSSMDGDESLSLLCRFESPHPPLPDSGRLVALLSKVVLILFGTVDRLGYQFTMSNTITPQFICIDLSGLAAIASQYTPDKPLCSCSVALGLQVNIHDLPILIHSSPKDNGSCH
jgi:hypothetical protein